MRQIVKNLLKSKLQVRTNQESKFLTAVPTDKGNASVVMNRADYKKITFFKTYKP